MNIKKNEIVQTETQHPNFNFQIETIQSLSEETTWRDIFDIFHTLGGVMGRNFLSRLDNFVTTHQAKTLTGLFKA